MFMSEVNGFSEYEFADAKKSWNSQALVGCPSDYRKDYYYIESMENLLWEATVYITTNVALHPEVNHWHRQNNSYVDDGEIDRHGPRQSWTITANNISM